MAEWPTLGVESAIENLRVGCNGAAFEAGLLAPFQVPFNHVRLWSVVMMLNVGSTACSQSAYQKLWSSDVVALETRRQAFGGSMSLLDAGAHGQHHH
jgi:hypothetical protein